jgi:RluA family pseudouridine synthase
MLYQNRVDFCHFDCAKAPGLNERKSVHISNIDRLEIVPPRELSHRPNVKKQRDSGIKWLVTDQESGTSLLHFLRQKVDARFSMRKLKQLIDSGACQLNGKAERFSTKFVGRGDTVHLMLSESPESHVALILEPQRILHADDDLLIYDKPPTTVSDDQRFLDLLQKEFGQLQLMHRLDRDTTGVLLFARTPAAAKKLLSQFQQRNIKKEYLAIVDGVPHQQSDLIENFLGKKCIYEGQALWGAVPKSKGLFAKTAWMVQQTGKRAALLLCLPETGRTHQIRVHLSEIGHPILGDIQYGGNSTFRSKRMMLHASKLLFQHPRHAQLFSIAAPLPADFQEILGAVIG